MGTMSNIIIAESVSIVNNYSGDNNVTQHVSCSNDKVRRLSKFVDKKAAACKIADKLLLIGETKRAYNMKACNSILELYTCECCGKTKVVNAHLCRDRLCPTCQYLLSVKRYNEMQKTIAAIPNVDEYSWRFVTLTIRNCVPTDLASTIGIMLKAWDKVCKRRTIKRYLKGWGRSLEITYNKGTGTFHPHIHFIAAFEKDNAPNLAEVTEWWQTALDIDYTPICDIDIPYSKNDNSITGAMIEAFKYCTKSKEVADMPLSSFAELVHAIKGVRLLAFGGIVRAARRNLGIIENDQAEQEVLDNAVCCDLQMQRAIAKWSFDENNYNLICGVVDDEKV